MANGDGDADRDRRWDVAGAVYPDESEFTGEAHQGWKAVETTYPTEVARWWHPEYELYVAIRHGDDRAPNPDWFTTFVELPDETVVSVADSTPQERNAGRVLHTVLEQFADGIPERIQRAIRRELDGESGTPPDAEWPGADNPRRPEAFADLQSWAEAHAPDAVLEAARADAYREAPSTIERRTWGSIRSALDTFGAEFVVDAVFSVVDGAVPTVDGQDRADWKRAFGSARATESPLPVYPESELPDERNGWELVGTRPNRVVYRSAEPHPLYDGAQRERKHIYLEAGRVQDPGDRRQRTAQHPWGVIRDLKARDWTSTPDPKVVVALLDSLDEAVTHLLAYMERWPARPVRGPLRGSSEDAYQGQALLHTLHYALGHLLEGGAYDGADTLADAFDAYVDAHVTVTQRGGVGLSVEQIRGDERIRDHEQQNAVYGFLDMLHPDVLEAATERATTADEHPFGFYEQRGDWQQALDPDTSGAQSQSQLGGGVDDTTEPRERPARSGAERASRESGQRDLGAAGERGLESFTGDDESGDEDGRARESPSEARRRRREARREQRDLARQPPHPEPGRAEHEHRRLDHRHQQQPLDRPDHQPERLQSRAPVHRWVARPRRAARQRHAGRPGHRLRPWGRRIHRVSAHLDDPIR